MGITGVDHLGLTVTDLDRSTSWYCERLGFEPLVGYSRPDLGAEVQVLQRPDGPLRISLRCFANGTGEPFDERHVGMDHVAFGVADADELAAWQARLESAGVSCHRTDQPALSIIVLRDPDNIQIELCTPLQSTSGDS